MRRSSRISRARRGFTLAEVAVTIVIMGIGLVAALQGLSLYKLTAAETRNMKLARELALLTMGQVESGLYQEDIQTGLSGSYADQGYPEFTYEVAVGDRSFRDATSSKAFDNFKPSDEKLKKDDEEKIGEPFEKVKIRVMFPKINEFRNELILERWMIWKQVYGETEDTDKDGAKKSGTNTATNSSSAGNNGNAGTTGSGATNK